MYRPKLLRRLAKLEKKLNIPADDRVKCSGALQKAEEIFIEGRRIHVEIDATGKFVRKSKKHEIDDKQRVLTFRQSNLSVVAQEPPLLDEKPDVSTTCGAYSNEELIFGLSFAGKATHTDWQVNLARPRRRRHPSRNFCPTAL